MCGIGDEWNKARASTEAQPEAVPPALIIFVKNPKKGKVKTRLAKTIGDDGALTAYMEMLAHTRNVAQGVAADRFLFYTDFVDPDDDWPNDAFRKALQPAGELGEKIAAAFQHVFAQGHDKVIIIGSDCLDLRRRHLEEAIAALDQHDFVIGPAEDGGYYLLGMREMAPKLFMGKAWSTETVYRDTLHDIAEMSARVHALEILSDIDYEEDWVAALKRRDGAP